MNARLGTVLRCHGPGEELKAEDVELVAGPGETLVEMRVAPVTQLDRTVLAGKLAQQVRPPFVPGSEGAGVVISSETFAAGSQVVIRGAGVGVSRSGTWGTLAVVPDASVHPLPEELDAAAAVALLASALTAHTAVRRVAQVVAGETVVITGATSLVGRLCAAVARSAGASKVIGLARSVEPVEALSALVDQVVRVDELGQVGRELPWCDAVIDTVGGPVISGVMSHITPGGRVAVLGYTAGEFATLDLHQLIGRDLRVLPVNMQRTTIEPGAVSQVLVDIAPARIAPEYELVPGARVEEALDLLARHTADRRVLLDLTRLR
ncbi:NADPH:quinone reductase-like Zn-dependent oxidoreductase [Kribbella sp. VKM Ac-2527]|uniref:NADPH:quinone reductase-like Zn-dependent oxidoreductase n=1 Tax=Kribbella caucasensis TaxID=2512215 RepID=A0A4R6KHY9_9ACTN|nr:zinc-binding alcohol dehydrogenase family protein [Kribbella sp. VKM Ac-2527]TDO50127.1 NADPH:quinone reductase-like Zn-dependent oxidoreductase [Kribbella sp. VKM Ac-2527]